MTQQRLAVYQLLEQMVSQFSERVQVNQITSEEHYSQVSKSFLRNRELIFTNLHNNKDINSRIEEQLGIANNLSVMSFDIHRRSLPKESIYFDGLLQLRTVAEEYLASGKLREDITNTIDPV